MSESERGAAREASQSPDEEMDDAAMLSDIGYRVLDSWATDPGDYEGVRTFVRAALNELDALRRAVPRPEPAFQAAQIKRGHGYQNLAKLHGEPAARAPLPTVSEIQKWLADYVAAVVDYRERDGDAETEAAARRKVVAAIETLYAAATETP